eukprot:jgi/Bigna1/87212/estExt_fgenesh1_pg.C_170223
MEINDDGVTDFDWDKYYGTTSNTEEDRRRAEGSKRETGSEPKDPPTPNTEPIDWSSKKGEIDLDSDTYTACSKMANKCKLTYRGKLNTNLRKSIRRAFGFGKNHKQDPAFEKFFRSELDRIRRRRFPHAQGKRTVRSGRLEEKEESEHRDPFYSYPPSKKKRSETKGNSDTKGNSHRLVSYVSLPTRKLPQLSNSESLVHTPDPRSDKVVEVPAHLAFAFALPLERFESVLRLEKDGEMLKDISGRVSIAKRNAPGIEDCKLHISRWRATKENVLKALRSNCFALLVGCHHTEEHGFEFENDNPGGKAVHVSSKDFLKIVMDAKETLDLNSLKILMLAACHSEAAAKGAFGHSKLADHVIVCREKESIGDNTFRLFQTAFFENLLGGASVSTSFRLAEEKLLGMATDIEKQVDKLRNSLRRRPFLKPCPRGIARVTMLEEQISELKGVKNFLLLPEGGDHDVRFSFKPYSPSSPKLKTWVPARPEGFNPAPFQRQLIWAVDNYLQLQRSSFSALQHGDSDQANSNSHRWVQMRGPKKSGRSSIAKYIAWRLSLYDMEGPDGIFWPQLTLQLSDMLTGSAEETNTTLVFAQIIDDVDDVAADDRAKLFKNLMSLGSRLHILTISENRIDVEGLNSNSDDLDLGKKLCKLHFIWIFRRSAHSLRGKEFAKQMGKIKPKHFSRLWDSEKFEEKHKVIQTAFHLVQKIRKKFNADHHLEINSPSFLVDVFGELLKENTV